MKRDRDAAADNPWVPMLVGFVYGRRATAERVLLLLIAMLSSGLATFWWWAIAAGDLELIEQAGEISYVACVMAAFLAPGMGAASRAALDRHVLLAESFATPLTMASYRGALRRRVLWLAGGASLFAAATALGIVGALAADPAYFRKLNTGIDLMAFFLRVLRLQLYGEPGGLPWAAGAMVALVVNFGAGFYLNATVLTCLCQLRPMVRLEGAMATALLLAVMPLVLIGCASVLYNLPTTVIDVGWGRMYPLNPWHVIPLVVLVYAALRVALAEWLWARRFPASFAETRRLVLKDKD